MEHCVRIHPYGESTADKEPLEDCAILNAIYQKRLRKNCVSELWSSIPKEVTSLVHSKEFVREYVKAKKSKLVNPK